MFFLCTQILELEKKKEKKHRMIYDRVNTTFSKVDKKHSRIIELKQKASVLIIPLLCNVKVKQWLAE